MFELPGSRNSNKPKQYIDPFNKSSFSRAFIHVSKSIWKPGTFEFEATIGFKKGDTSGEQKIKGESFPDLIEKVNAFMQSLD